MLEKYDSTPEYQDRILACIIQHPARFLCYQGVLNSAYFSSIPRIVTARAIFGYVKKHARFPAWDVLVQKVYEGIERTAESKEEESIMDYLKLLKDMDTGDIDSVVEDVIKFARKRAYLITLQEAFEGWQHDTLNVAKICNSFEEAAKIGQNEDEVEDCATAMKLETPPVIIEGIAHRGSKLMIGGGSKSKKTWALMDLAFALATGGSWWGRKCNQGVVLYVNFELPKPFFQDRLEDIRKAKGVSLEPGKLHHLCLRGKIVSMEQTMPETICAARRVGATLVIIDPIYKLMLGVPGKKDENSATDIARVMAELERLAVQTDCAVAFAAHFSKGNQAGRDHLDRVSGSGVFARDPDCILTMTAHEHEDVYAVEVTARNFPPLGAFCVRWKYPLFDVAEDCSPENLKQPKKGPNKTFSDWEFLRRLPVETEEPTACATFRARMLTETGMSDDTYRRRVRELVQSKRILQVGEGFLRAGAKTA